MLGTNAEFRELVSQIEAKLRAAPRSDREGKRENSKASRGKRWNYSDRLPARFAMPEKFFLVLLSPENRHWALPN